MIIENVRLGHANNSSSTHSIAFGLKHVSDQPPEDTNYGWDAFTLSRADSKLRYLHAFIAHALNHLGPATAHAIAGQVTGLSERPGEIDHQSLVTLPDNPEFLRDLTQYLTRSQDVTILGGNDNAGEHPLANDAEHSLPVNGLVMGVEGDRNGPWLEAHRDGDWWVLFNPVSGAKLALSFQPNPAPRSKSVAPELVDLSITDQCSFGCPYCYRGSTREGRHAPTEEIEQVLEALAETGTLEIAFGGGEPTQHPDFAHILRYTRHLGMQPNFTTFDVRPWLGTPLHVAVEEVRASFAVSVHSPRKVEQQREVLERFGMAPNAYPVSFQYVLGVAPDPEWEKLKTIMAETGWGGRLTLLGFKSTERGATYPASAVDPGWIDVVDDIFSPYVAVDTVLASRFHARLRERLPIQIGVAPHHEEKQPLLYYLHEGRFSLFIDVTKRLMGPSSYHLEHLTELPIDLTSDRLRQAWFETPVLRGEEPLEAA